MRRTHLADTRAARIDLSPSNRTPPRIDGRSVDYSHPSARRASSMTLRSMVAFGRRKLCLNPPQPPCWITNARARGQGSSVRTSHDRRCMRAIKPGDDALPRSRQDRKSTTSSTSGIPEPEGKIRPSCTSKVSRHRFTRVNRVPCAQCRSRERSHDTRGYAIEYDFYPPNAARRIAR